ncbi:MAG: EamA family transporter [Chlamydiae bacterium]|nr:EamA family transporter [Chlamydiota bacterium]
MKLAHLLLTLLITAVWGFNFVAIKAGLEEIPPILLCAIRFFLTSIPFLLFIKRPTSSFKLVVLYGLVMFALQFCLLFIGMYAGVTAGLAAILLQIQVFFTVLLAVLFFKEKLTKWQIIGGLVSCLGIALVGMNLEGDLTLLGFILVITAAAFWGTGSVIAKKIGKINVIELVVWGSLVAWPPLLLVSLLVEGPAQIASSLHNISWLSVVSILYITVASTMLGFGVWNWLIHRYPLSTMAPFLLLVPIFAMLGSTLTLGEELQLWKVISGVLVIAGLGLNFLAGHFLSKRKLKNTDLVKEV